MIFDLISIAQEQEFFSFFYFWMDTKYSKLVKSKPRDWIYQKLKCMENRGNRFPCSRNLSEKGIGRNKSPTAAEDSGCCRAIWLMVQNHVGLKHH